MNIGCRCVKYRIPTVSPMWSTRKKRNVLGYSRGSVRDVVENLFSPSIVHRELCVHHARENGEERWGWIGRRSVCVVVRISLFRSIDLIQTLNTARNVLTYCVCRKHRKRVIYNNGFLPYFKAVGKICAFVDNDLKSLRGWGRGSAGGSLVAMLYGITKVDPIRWGLYFERFLNPSCSQIVFVQQMRDWMLHVNYVLNISQENSSNRSSNT